MNKRDFLKTILLGCVAPSLFLPRIELPKWKRHGELWTVVYEINPEWKNARYEYTIVGADSGTVGYDGKSTIIYDCKTKGKPLHRLFDNELQPQQRVWDPFYVRGNEFDSNGKIVSIAPFIGRRRLIT